MDLQKTAAYRGFEADVAEMTATVETHFGQPYAHMLAVFAKQCLSMSGVLLLLSSSLQQAEFGEREEYWQAGATGASKVLMHTLEMIGAQLPPGPKRVELLRLALQIGKRSLRLVHDARAELEL